MPSKAVSKAASVAIVALVVLAILAGVAYHYMVSKGVTETSTSTTTVTSPQTAATTHTTSTTTSTSPPSPSSSTLTSTTTATTSPTTGTVSSTTAPTTTTATTTQGVKYVEVRDLSGKLVKVRYPVRRVVVLQSYWAEVVVALGAGDKIVGVGKWVKYDQYLPESVRSKPSVGSLFSGVNVEEVAALKPDVVITDYGYGKANEVISKLEGMGIPVIRLFCRSFNDQLKAISIIGKVLGAQGRAEELIKFMKSKYDLVREDVLKAPSKPRVVMLSAYGLLKGYLSTYANTSWGRLINEVGAINIALQKFPNKSWPKIDFETLAEWDPDVIVIVGSKSELVAALDKVLSDEKFSVLKAVKEGRVYAVPAWGSLGGVLDWGPRIVIGYEYLAKLLHPKACSNIDWRADAVYLLKHFYGVNVPEQAFVAYSIRWKEVVDFSGKAVKVPLHVRRVVDLISYVNDLALGVMNRLVGVSKYAHYNPILKKAYPNITKIPSPGSSFSLNIEQLAALKPDVVIMWNYKPSIVSEVEKLGIPVICVNVRSYNDVKALLILLGNIYGVENRAMKLINDMDKIVSMVEERVSSIPQDKRVKVLYLWSKPTWVQGGVGCIEDAIRMAGCVNPAAKYFPNKAYPIVDFEQIVKWNPDLIVIWWYARYGPKDILSNAKWSVINAVKEGRVYKEPFYEHWGPGISLFVLWLASKAYPNLFKDVNVTAIMDKYYEEWYGIKYTELFTQGGSNAR